MARQNLPQQNGILCPRCAAALPADSLLCQFCGAALGSLPVREIRSTKSGKRENKELNKILLCVTATLAVLVLLVSAAVMYFRSLRSDAMRYLQEGAYAKAISMFDELPGSDLTFRKEMDCAQAGLLMENGDHLGALEAFNELDDGIVPTDIYKEVRQIVYRDAEYAYGMEWIGEAERQFRALKDYEKSEVYLFLIECRRTNMEEQTQYRLEKTYARLLESLDVADAGEIMLSSWPIAELFLEGQWKSHSSYGEPEYFFELIRQNGDSESRYDLPCPGENGYYYINDGVFSVGDTEGGAKDFFHFTIVNRNTVHVYCYADENTYTLYRQ